MKFVIIGGDAAGMSAASRAKRTDPGLEVIVLEQTQDVSYSACGMPYNIADPGRSIDELVVRKAEVFRQKQGIDLRTGHRVEAIDPSRRTVSGTGTDRRPFVVAYDRLLIATGARPAMPDLPGIDNEGVVALKNLEDGRRIKALLRGRNAERVVILGMGYIALEMAEALRSRGIAVSLVKPRPGLLPWMAPELSAVVGETLAANGVVRHDGQRPERIEARGDRLRVVGEGLDLPADMVLVATGVVPNSEMAAAAGLALGPGGAIAVDRRVRTSVPDIYAAGDCADAFHVVTGRRVYIPLALRANRAGWAAADNVCGRPTELEGVAGTAVFKVFHLEVARSGLTMDEAAAAGFDPVSVVVTTSSRAHAHPGAGKIHVHLVGDRASGMLLGAQMVGTEGAAHRINAVAVALHAKMTVKAFVQADLSYAPPFGPVWDPLLTAANQLLKKL
ncbi:MAG: FAD-dependent oxidoreductase [Deltaproteobacteria bacterium]|nr:FAD-dependent oxidoreductase [Deltaproteobacteria bacterium]RLB98226.1 MAG: pyridine nucleotide-disulfide oxidoreductase [Deltaproteobacteria bacterium]